MIIDRARNIMRSSISSAETKIINTEALSAHFPRAQNGRLVMIKK